MAKSGTGRKASAAQRAQYAPKPKAPPARPQPKPVEKHLVVDDTLKKIMLAEETTQYRLYAKTGWATRTPPSVGWYVGFVETHDDTWLFALNLVTRDAKDLPLRIQIAKDALKVKGVLKR